MFGKKKIPLSDALEDIIELWTLQRNRALDKVMRASGMTSKDDVAAVESGLPKLETLWKPVICIAGQRVANPQAKLLHEKMLSYLQQPDVWKRFSDHYGGIELDVEEAARIVEASSDEGIGGVLLKEMLDRAYPSIDFQDKEIFGGIELVTCFNYVEHVSSRYKIID